ERFGAGISAHPLFPNRTNVAFARVQPGDSIEAVVYERGVGITQACGSGACAVAAAAVRRATWARDTPAPVRLPGGVLTITVGADDALTMEGEAVFVFAGALELDRFGVPDPGRPDPGAEP